MTDLVRTGALETTVLEAAAGDVHAAGIPGIFAEVRVRDDVWRGAAGVADLVTRAPVTPGMRHRVGSISKTFVAAAVLQLVERRAVDLDAPIRRYLPNLVPGGRGDAITVRMLLNHTSGLADYLPTAYPSLAAFPVVADTSPRSLDDNRFTRFDPLDLIEMGVRASTAAAPGTSPGRYSNTNYLLVGMVVDAATGRHHSEEIRRRILEPLGLTSTFYWKQQKVTGRIAHGYVGVGQDVQDVTDLDFARGLADGAMVASVADMAKFVAAIGCARDHALLTAQLADL